MRQFFALYLFLLVSIAVRDIEHGEDGQHEYEEQLPLEPTGGQDFAANDGCQGNIYGVFLGSLLLNSLDCGGIVCFLLVLCLFFDSGFVGVLSSFLVRAIISRVLY